MVTNNYISAIAVICKKKGIVMHYQYSSYQTETEIDGIGICTTYGIRFSCGKDIITDIRDVSTEPDTVSEIVRLLNRNAVSPIHAAEVIIDLIG